MKAITLAIIIGLMLVSVCGQNGMSPTLMKLLAVLMNNSDTEMDKKNKIIEVIETPNAAKMLRNVGIDPILAKAIVESTNLTVFFTKTIDLGVALKAFPLDKNSFSIVVKSIDWCYLNQAIDIEMVLKYPNVTVIVGNMLSKRFGIILDPNLINIVVNYTDINELYKSLNIQRIIETLSASNITEQEKTSNLMQAIDMDALVNSIQLTKLLDNDVIASALQKAGVNNMVLQMIKTFGAKNILESIDVKSLVGALVSGKGFNLGIMTENIKWNKFIQNALGANVTLDVTASCGEAFTTMLLPIPDLSNINMNNVDALLKLQHPILQLFDSWDKLPSRILMGKKDWFGAVDQCSKIQAAKYCLANMNIAGNMIQGSYGFCIPQACSEDDGRLMLEYLSRFALGNTFSFPRKWWPPNRKNPVNCKKHIPYEDGFKITVAITVVFVVLSIIGTSVDEIGKYLEKKEEEEDEKNEEKKNTKNQKRLLVKVFTCFSLTRNASAILSTKVPKGAITCINGIRVITITWIIVGHTFAGLQGAPLDNILHLKELTHRHLTLVVMNAYPSVDTFFLLSGLLLSYLTFKRLDKTNGRLNLLMFYLHRFIRVTPLLMYAILLHTNIATAVNERSTMGLLRDESGSRKSCGRYWWTNMLYINNFFPKSFWQSCVPVTWYLANDMQFYIVSPVFLYSIYHLEKRFAKSRFRNFSGAIVVSIGCFICVLINFILILHNNYPAMHAAYQMRITGNPRANRRLDPQDETYDKPYTRISPYLIGILVGYMLSRDIKLDWKSKKFFNVIFWLAAVVGGYYIIYGPSQMYKKNPVFLTDSENVSFGSLHMLAWAIAVGWVIYSCHYGMGGIINDFLSWKAWMPLSRLTYCAYLLHNQVASYIMYAPHNGYHLQRTAFIFHFISINVTTFLLAFVVSVLVEVPIINLEKLLLS